VAVFSALKNKAKAKKAAAKKSAPAKKAVAKKLLTDLITKYPDSDAAKEAKPILASIK